MKNKKIISVIVLLMCISNSVYAQYRSKQDSLNDVRRTDSLMAVVKILKTEYIPYENLVYNNGKFSASTPLDTLKKIFKIKIEKCIDYDEDEKFEYDCYTIGNKGTKLANSSANVEVIRDTLITFDKYPKLRVGAPLSNMKEYFPLRYEDILLEYKDWSAEKKLKNRNQGYVMGCEAHEGYYPDHMSLLVLRIEFDLVTMTITSFEFFDGYE